MMAKFCSNCGNELPENAGMCVKCGVMINDTSSQKNKKKGFPVWAIVLIVVFCIIILPIVILVLLAILCFNYIEKSDINIEDYLDTYVLKSISKLCIHQFMANFYAFNSKNLTSKMYVQKDLRYNISIDTTYNVCSPDDKRLKSFEDLSEAIKYLMFVIFSDRDAYNKYIELYPNFLKGN